MEFRYVIIVTLDLNQAMLDACPIITSPRESDDGRTLLKWQGADPPTFDGYTKYDQAGIDLQLDKIEWNPTIPSA